MMHPPMQDIPVVLYRQKYAYENFAIPAHIRADIEKVQKAKAEEAKKKAKEELEKKKKEEKDKMKAVGNKLLDKISGSILGNMDSKKNDDE